MYLIILGKFDEVGTHSDISTTSSQYKELKIKYDNIIDKYNTQIVEFGETKAELHCTKEEIRLCLKENEKQKELITSQCLEINQLSEHLKNNKHECNTLNSEKEALINKVTHLQNENNRLDT